MNPDSVRGVCGGCGPAPLTVKEHLREVLLALLEEVLLALLEGRLSEGGKEALRGVLALS